MRRSRKRKLLLPLLLRLSKRRSLGGRGEPVHQRIQFCSNLFKNNLAVVVMAAIILAT